MRWVDYLVRIEVVEKDIFLTRTKTLITLDPPDVPITKTQAGSMKRIHTKEVVRMARIVPMGIDF